MTSRRVKLLLVVLLLPVSCLLAELVIRVALWAGGDAYDGDATRGQIERIVGRLGDPIPQPDGAIELERTVAGSIHGIHPYYGWEARDFETLVGGQAKQYRLGQFDEGFEVMIVGGSVAGQVASWGRDAIVRVLAADPRLADRPVRVLNHARAAFKEPQQVMVVAYLFSLGYRPDAVVNIDGFNEVALGTDNAALGAHPLYPHWPRWGHVGADRARGDELAGIALDMALLRRDAVELADTAVARGYPRSVVLGRWTLWRLGRFQERWLELQEAYVVGLGAGGGGDPARGPAFPAGSKIVFEMITGSWKASSVSLKGMCDARGITYLHVLQPTLHDEGSKPLTPEEIASSGVNENWIRGAREGYPLLRATGRELVEAGVNYLDGSDTFAELSETTYYDACHFRGVGMELFAERIARELLRVLP